MSTMLLSEIISEGMLQAGDTSLTARMTSALKTWLRAQAGSFLWPQLKREGEAIALAKGIQRLKLGGGNGGITQEISRINDPLKIYTASFSGSGGDIRVTTDWGPGNLVNDIVNNPATNIGCPSRCRVKQASGGGTQDLTNQFVWDVIFDRVADQAYLLEISYYLMPQFGTIAERCWYPNDLTLIQVVYANVLKFKKDLKAYAQALEVLGGMVAHDRMSEGMKPGINNSVPLNTSIFK